jgi:hypothetical protein
MPIAAERTTFPRDRVWSLAGRALRLVLLLVLLTCGLMVFNRAFPHEATAAQLAEDLRQRRVTHIELDVEDVRAVRWSNGLLTWYQTIAPPGWSRNADPSFGTPDSRIKVTPRQVDLHTHVSPVELLHPVYLAGPAGGLLWLLLLLVMLDNRRDHRYASAWAWFWMFTVGLAGALVYLLVETRPLWAHGADGPPGEAARRLHGSAGFLMAVLLGLATTGAAFGLRAILG